MTTEKQLIEKRNKIRKESQSLSPIIKQHLQTWLWYTNLSFSIIFRLWWMISLNLQKPPPLIQQQWPENLSWLAWPSTSTPSPSPAELTWPRWAKSRMRSCWLLLWWIFKSTSDESPNLMRDKQISDFCSIWFYAKHWTIHSTWNLMHISIFSCRPPTPPSSSPLSPSRPRTRCRESECSLTKCSRVIASH